MRRSFELQPVIGQAEHRYNEALKAQDHAYKVAAEEIRTATAVPHTVVWWDLHIQHLGEWRMTTLEVIKLCEVLYDLYCEMAYALSAEGSHAQAGSFEELAAAMQKTGTQFLQVIEHVDTATAMAQDLQGELPQEAPELAAVPASAPHPVAASPISAGSDGGSLRELVERRLALVCSALPELDVDLDAFEEMDPGDQLRVLRDMESWWTSVVSRYERLLNLDEEIIAARKQERERARTEVARADAKHDRVLKRLSHARPDDAELIAYDVEIAEIELEGAQEDLIFIESELRGDKGNRKESKSSLKEARENLEEIRTLIALH